MSGKLTMQTIHCFSVDLEGFCEGHAEHFFIPADMLQGKRQAEEIAANADSILEFLSAHKVKATFFILGTIARQQPQLLKAIAAQGHEIAAHGYEHTSLDKMNRKTAEETIIRSKKTIEDATGLPVYGFRAPYFSIAADAVHILEIVRNCGFIYDSSIPSNGGIRMLKNGLIEFSPSAYFLNGRAIPALGGGYFRLSPLPVLRHFVRKIESKNYSGMFYIHPYEIGRNYPVFRNLSALKKFRYYFNVATAKEKFDNLFSQFSFGRAIDILRLKGFIN